MATRRLYRSRTDRVIAGVAGGLADYLDIDSAIIRLIFIVLLFFGGTGLLLYVLGWVLIPEEGGRRDRLDETPHEDSPRRESVSADAPRREDSNNRKESAHNDDRSEPSVVAGLILLALGVLFLFQNLTGFAVWRVFWPVVLIAIGISLMTRPGARQDRTEQTRRSPEHTANTLVRERETPPPDTLSPEESRKSLSRFAEALRGDKRRDRSQEEKDNQERR